ncbi:hypothetical protein [Archangium sp.]|uniref:hypothetical protein n=1 Tax=Archangium sp. TaxID=1872627 RepID=UPI00286C56F0|nr:hypothetical protein [Archangium sp.]
MHPGGTFSFDESQWPLLVVKLTGEPSSLAFEDYLARSTQYLQRQERHVCVFDVSALQILSTEQRQRQVEWLKANEVLMSQTLLGVSYVVTSPVIRLTLGVIFHFKPPRAPYAFHTHLGEAREWAVRRLDEAGLRTSAERIRHMGMPAVETKTEAPPKVHNPESGWWSATSVSRRAGLGPGPGR